MEPIWIKKYASFQDKTWIFLFNKKFKSLWKHGKVLQSLYNRVVTQYLFIGPQRQRTIALIHLILLWIRAWNVAFDTHVIDYSTHFTCNCVVSVAIGTHIFL